MLLSFDVDCGQLIQGHRFVARESRPGNRRPRLWEGDFPAFSLEFARALSPRVRIERRSYLVGIIGPLLRGNPTTAE